MKELTFKVVEVVENGVYNGDNEQVDIYVDGELAMVNVRSDILESVEELEKFHDIDGVAEISKLMIEEIDEQFNLVEDEKTKFTHQLIDIIKGKIW